MEIEGKRYTYEILRGSIPLLWSSPCSPSVYNPPVTIDPNLLSQVSAYKKFLLHESTRLIYVNLVDKKGDQKRLGTLFKQIVEEVPSDHVYIWHDFHSLTSESFTSGVSKITADCVSLSDYGTLTDNGKVIKRQRKHIRVNCMDCLDRTNVIQSSISLEILKGWMSDNGLELNGEGAEWYKRSWGKNADEIARHYAGTNALKRDFTRKGRRTNWGKMEDGINSGVRWYKGNFMDSSKLEGLRIFFGGCYSPPSPPSLESSRKSDLVKTWRKEFKDKRINRGGGEVRERKKDGTAQAVVGVIAAVGGGGVVKKFAWIGVGWYLMRVLGRFVGT
ncbi:hypothetical protein TrST_g7715 [Triparma strigata]|uniref:SAC domain-containing protein n=1 Tax=Triparma strigata TaxID=1606541 RepID=A0A9W7A5Y2_9STRA|nr:hypothetical protein TrST_g7715 [Triparma strigata]